MSDFAEIIENYNSIIKAQANAISRLSMVLLQHIEADEVEKLLQGSEAERCIQHIRRNRI